MDELISLIADRVKKKLVSRGLDQPVASSREDIPNNHFEPQPQSSQLVDLATVQNPAQLAHYIDHTLLKPEASKDELRTLCEEAKEHHFYSVCVNSSNVAFCKQELSSSNTLPIAVVGFPLGATTTDAKAFETKQAIKEGALEIDMVINIGALKAKDYVSVLADIQGVVQAAGKIPVKVILETGLLNQEEKIIGCTLSKVAGAAFVKTSTGFNKGGATIEDIELMRHIVGPELGVKASGGVRTTKDAMAMLKAGANRIGASASVAIVTGKSTQSKGY